MRHRIDHLVDERLDVFDLGVQEHLWRVVGGGERQQVDGGETGLLARRHENDDGLARAVSLDRVVRRPGHGQQPGSRVRHVQALDVELERDGANVRVEVERAVGAAAEPVGDVLGVGHGSAEGQDPDGLLELRRDVAHARAHDLDDRTLRASEQVDLVADEQLHVLHVLPLLPAAREDVPLFRRRDDDVPLCDQLQVGGLELNF